MPKGIFPVKKNISAPTLITEELISVPTKPNKNNLTTLLSWFIVII